MATMTIRLSEVDYGRIQEACALWQSYLDRDGLRAIDDASDSCMAGALIADICWAFSAKFGRELRDDRSTRFFQGRHKEETMGTHHADGGYSAEVAISLEIHGEALDVGRLGPDRLSLAAAPTVEIVAGDRGIVTLEIDGEPQQWPIEVLTIADRPDNPIEDSTHIEICFRAIVD